MYIINKMQRVGSRAQVMHGNAKMTGGGLKKKDLKYNKQGKIVSKMMSTIAKKGKRLQRAGYTTVKGQFGAIKINSKKDMEGGAGRSQNNKTQKLKRLTNEELEKYKTQSYYGNLVKEIKRVNEKSNNRRQSYQNLRRKLASKSINYMARHLLLGMVRYTHIWMNRIQATVFIIGPEYYDFTKSYNTEYDNLNFVGLALDAPLLVNKGVNQNRRIGTSSSQLLYTSTLSDSRKLSYNKNIEGKYKSPEYMRQEYGPHFSIIKKFQIEAIKKLVEIEINKSIDYHETYKDLLYLNTDWTYFWDQTTVYNTMILFVPKKIDELDEGVEPPNIMHVDVTLRLELEKLGKDSINKFLETNNIDILYISGHNYDKRPTYGYQTVHGGYDVEQSIFLNYKPEWFETIIQINYSDAKPVNVNVSGLKKVKNITTFKFLK
jgi:hypothetical protein